MVNFVHHSVLTSNKLSAKALKLKEVPAEILCLGNAFVI